MAGPENEAAVETGRSGATGWEALIPLDWDRLRHLTNEPVPRHIKRWWFSLGGTPAYLFFIQITTGLLLTFYYQPGAEGAYESMQRITHSVPFGWFLRSIHMWAANLMIITVILHVLRVFFTRAYRHPRTLNWIFGVSILLCTLGMGFTGYSLVNEQLSYWGATVATNLTESVPIVGPAMATLLRGGPEITSHTLTRFFLLHVGIIPALMIGLIGLHLTFVRLHGVTEYEFETEEKKSKSGTFAAGWLAVCAGLGALFALWNALSATPAFDLVGYIFLPATSRILLLIIAGALCFAAVSLWRKRLAGLMILLTLAVLSFAKVVRDLLLGEAQSSGTWTVLLIVIGFVIAVGIAMHRTFREKEKPDEGKTFNFFPDHMLMELMIGTGLLVLLTLLCLLFPADLAEKADPFTTPDHIKPEWYFYFQFRLLKISPGVLGLTSLDVSMLLTGLILGILFLWPWIDRGIERLFPKRNLPIYVGVAGFLLFLTFTVWEAMAH